MLLLSILGFCVSVVIELIAKFVRDAALSDLSIEVVCMGVVNVVLYGCGVVAVLFPNEAKNKFPR